MSIKFFLHYESYAGEDLTVSLIQRDGSVKQFRMHSTNNREWVAICDAVPTVENKVEYFYSVYRQATEIRREWQQVNHHLELPDKDAVYVCYDRWNDIQEDSYLYSSAFTEAFNRHTVKPIPQQEGQESQKIRKPITIKVHAPQVESDESLYLVGEGGELGEWRSDRAMPLYELAPNEWYATIDASTFQESSITFKFIIKNNDGRAEILWEEGENRTIHFPAFQPKERYCYEVERAFFRKKNERFAGTAVPVFSLRTKGSFGVGDFGDLKKMIDWVKMTGQRILQILPINDTTMTRTWQDSYPYNAVSIFALHPMYCDLRQLPSLKDPNQVARFETMQKTLNAIPQIDYEAVNCGKREYFRCLFDQEGKKILSTEEFKEWFEEEQHWLVPYAKYTYLCEQYGTADHTKWKNNQVWDEKEREALTNFRTKAFKTVSLHYMIQYFLAKQMKEVHRYARKAGVVLKGDIPIGVNRYGCDVWVEPRYFNLNGQAGAPPDSFSVNGQNWGFPTYNWTEMLKDNCAWWVRRFSNMAKYFDAYRIDHVLGFFRIWEIPLHAVHGLLGQFQPSLGMTINEIEQYGLKWNEELMTKPFITDWVLDRWLGDRAKKVKEEFLVNTHDDCYEMKPEFDTQRKVEAYFAKKYEGSKTNMSDYDITLRDTLYALISNVLFVRDHNDPNKFHPRISAQFDPCYETLWDSDKEKYNALYNDYFYRRNNHFWYHEAMKKLPAIVNATRMLVCAEDLGMVPDCVPWVMNELKILSLEIQNMPKETNLKFGNLSNNPYRSVCTISSHDTETMRMWWDMDHRQTQAYSRTVLFRGGTARRPGPGWLARDIICRHLASPSMLCILTIQDWLAMNETLRLPDADAERINIPSNPRHYWRYRMHLNIEDLMDCEEFTYTIQGLLQETGR